MTLTEKDVKIPSTMESVTKDKSVEKTSGSPMLKKKKYSEKELSPERMVKLRDSK